ncbi:MAG: hypothetical protein ABIA37_01445 [Candidatus Woesearchaeota archaeon]
MTENCYVCEGKGSFLHLNRLICKKCFLRTIEKRVKKHLGRRLFKKDDQVLVVGEVERELLESAVKEMPLQIVAKKKLPKKVKGVDFIVIGKTLDELDGEFLKDLFQGRIGISKKAEEKIKMFNILEPLTDEEVKIYAGIKKIKVEIKDRKEPLKLFEEYKELKYNLYNTIKELRGF